MESGGMILTAKSLSLGFLSLRQNFKGKESIAEGIQVKKHTVLKSLG